MTIAKPASPAILPEALTEPHDVASP